ncbi:50S ribosome-binding GTPase [Mesobacillus persicus]|uniref:50S ribosome-binding GTPase n=1 Tax=Mesobacillus persicus TaxID=930146 RepID=A0A1H8K844_9BACI|nr:GTPase [Mesobacillus persicus]SEN88861.1 50S ribosome-binding GTPase [Mesobacillus persicus]
MLHTFIDFQEKRYQWAFNAKRDFLNRFQMLDVKSLDTDKKELTISVYGPTQVGKTTLILALLGIREEELLVVSEFLRGTRAIGESSTVTVTKYIQSPDDNYHVKFPNNEILSDINEQDLELAMYKLRQRIENGQDYSVEPVIIAIPKHLFGEREISIEIVDLPGVESAEENEVEHVQQCIKHWMPLTELCLLVNDAADIKAFAQFTLKDLRRWHDHPQNYRVILTRATTLDSVMKDIQQNKICQGSDLIDYYAKLLAAEMNVDTDFNEIIYPVEIGVSMKRIRGLKGIVYQRVKVIVQEIMDKLINDFASTDFNKLSFSFLTKLYREAELDSKVELEESELRIQMIKARLDNLRAMRNTYTKIADKIRPQEERIRSLNKVRLTISQEQIRLKEFSIDKEIENKIPADFTNRYASVINQAAVHFQYQTEVLLNKKIREINWSMKGLRVDGMDELTLVDVAPVYGINSIINKFWTDRKYFKELFSVRESCVRWLEHVHEIYSNNLSEKLGTINEQVDELNKEISQIKDLYEQDLNNMTLEIKKVKVQLAELNEEHIKLRQRWEEDCLHARQLQQYFIKHWLLYKERLQQKCLYGLPEEKWLALRYLQHLVKDGQLIINSLDTVEDNTL